MASGWLDPGRDGGGSRTLSPGAPDGEMDDGAGRRRDHAAVQLRCATGMTRSCRYRRRRPWRHRAGADGGARHRDAGERRRPVHRTGAVYVFRDGGLERYSWRRWLCSAVFRRCEASNPESRDPVWRLTRHPGMTVVGLTTAPSRYDKAALIDDPSSRCPSTPSPHVPGHDLWREPRDRDRLRGRWLVCR